MPASTRTALEWATKQFSIEKADEGFSRISGTAGSGKSHLVKLFLMDALKEVESNPYAKLIMYEPKREFYAWLSSLGLKSKITYFMPSDTRSVALDFTEDYEDDMDADTLAYAFNPERPSNQESPFWGDSMRTIYAGVFSAIRSRLGYADLRLVCLVLEDDELTRQVLSGDPYLVQARKLTSVTGKSISETAQNIQYTIHARIGKMKVLAAHLDCAARERPLFSLRRFIREPHTVRHPNSDREPNSGILVVSKASKYRLVQDPMNGVLLLRFTDLLDNEQQDPRRKIFVVVDEFPTLCGDDRCPGVKDMFLRLRSRGAVPLITDQGLTTLKPLYGDDTTAILGQCSNVIYMRQPDVESATEAAKDLGSERGYEIRSNFIYGGKTASVGQTEHPYDRTIVEPSILQNLFLATPERGIEGYAKSALNPEKKPWHFTVPPQRVAAILKTPRDIAEYEERPSHTQRLRQLEDHERDALLGKDEKSKLRDIFLDDVD